MPVLDELEYVSISLQKILSRLTILKFSLKKKRWMSQGRDIVTQIKVKAVAGEGKKESLQGMCEIYSAKITCRSTSRTEL